MTRNLAGVPVVVAVKVTGISPVRIHHAVRVVLLEFGAVVVNLQHLDYPLALPRMRQIVVPHTGHLPLAMFMPVLETSTAPS